MEKRRPTYDLESIKAALGSIGSLAMTTSALRDATALGFDRAGVVAVIGAIDRSMFVKSITTYADHRLGRMATTSHPLTSSSTSSSRQMW